MYHESQESATHTNPTEWRAVGTSKIPKDQISISSVYPLQFDSGEVEEQVTAPSEANIECNQLFGSPSKATSILDGDKTHKDAIVFISRLPQELLTYVFLILRDIQPTSWFGPRATRVTGLGWIVVTHVCSSWRSAAIGWPALWTKDTFSLGGQWAECILSRSHQVPVEITYRIEDQSAPVERDAKLIAKHLTHTRSLMISTEDLSLYPFLQKLTSPAPVLHTLEFLGPVGFAPERDPTLIASIPDNFLANDSPCLRDLLVYGAFVPWSSPMLRNLQTLDLSLPNLSQRPALRIPSLTQFLDALAQMPDLETLCAIGVLPTFSPSRDVLVPVDRKVALPRMIDLSLGGETFDVALALSRLTVPPNSHLSLSCISCSSPSHAATLFQLISDHLGSANPILIRELNVEGSDHFEIWGTMTFTTRTSRGLSVSFDWSIHDAELLLHHFFVALPQLQISGIHLCDMPLTSRSKWQHVFARENMASVKSVVISEDPECFGGLIRFLSRPIASVPTLRTLKCIDMDFVDECLWLDHLREVLETRKENGVPLQKISFYRCSSLDEQLVGHLEDIVPTVIVSDDFPPDDESSDGDFDGPLGDELEDPSNVALGRSSSSG